MIVVSDTSSLFYAAQIDCEQLFQQVFGEVIIPEAVHQELLANHPSDSISRLLSHSWIKVQIVEKNSLLQDLLLHIDRGESEAIVLALQLNAKFLLIDERRGRAIARKFQVRTTGLLGIFLLAKQQGVITEIKSLVQKLTSQTSFRHSSQLIAAVLASAGER